MKRIILPAPAKVNLFLRILGKRSDGYHEILSLMQPVSLYDRVTVSVAEGYHLSVRCSSPLVPVDAANTAWKAAELFLREAGLERKVDIEIEKRIPVGAGLGGGSADAAAALKGLNVLLGEPYGEGKLVEIASSIGSDVPFFIRCRSAIASGRGEKLKAVRLPGYHYLLVNPGFQVSTAWAYGSFDLTKAGKDNIFTYSEDSFGEIEGLKGLLVNDLEGVTEARYPVVAEIKEALKENGAAAALMSGSGPTVFGLYKDRDSRSRAFESLKGILGERFLIFEADGITG